MIDLHVHTWRCRHATGTVEEYVRAAAERGVRTLAFTEHMPMPPALATAVPGADGYAMPVEELPEYMTDLARAAAVGRAEGVEVLAGIEIDAIPQGLEHAAGLLDGSAFDIVLGSVHFIDSWAFDDPERTAGYDAWDIAALWERYFEDVAVAARSGLVDVIAHADLVKKFCRYPAGPVEHLYERAAEQFAEAGVAVEVNTAGLRKPCREIYPAPAFLKALRRRGVAVTMGSDAHAPADVGAGAAEALAALRDAGYTSAVVFRKRQPMEVYLDEL